MNDAAQSRLSVVFIALTLSAWCMGELYRGFSHDAIFYAADAVNRLPGHVLGIDPFFAFGSQGDFSLFMQPYAWWVNHAGYADAALTTTVIGRALWLIALGALCAVASPSHLRAWAFALPLILSPYYEPYKVFAYGEAFATPRIWVEAAGMFAVALALRGRWAWAAVLTLVACALHPLMGLPVAVAMLMWKVAAVSAGTSAARHKRWLIRAALVAAGLSVAGLLCAARIAPFDRLAQSYDHAWWQIVLKRNMMVAAQNWDVDDFARVAVWLLLLFPTWRRLKPESALRPLAVAIGTTAVVCLATWIVGSLLHNVLLVQLQLWRVMWLVQLTVPALWVASWAARRPQPLDGLALAEIALVLGALISATINGLLLMGLAVALHLWGDRLPTARARRAAIAVSIAAVALIALSRLAALPSLAVMARMLQNSPHPWLQALAWEPTVWVLLLALLWWSTRRVTVGGPVALLAGALSGALLLGSLSYWFMDARTKLRADATPAWILSLRQHIPVGSTVYWSRPPSSTWLQLERPIYASNMQGASALFSRPGALELQRRLERLRSVGLASGPAAWAGDPGSQRLTARSALLLCQDPALDFVLLDSTAPEAQLSVPGPAGKPLALFRCQTVRDASSAPRS